MRVLAVLLVMSPTLFGNKMNYSPGAIANYFLTKAWNKLHGLTPVHLQKLMYFANGWHMAFSNKDSVMPLINEPFQAWEYGPVCASVYHEFKGFGSNPIPKDYKMKELDISGDFPHVRIVVNTIPKSDKKVIKLLDNVLKKYAAFTAVQLSSMTHSEDDDNPWRLAKKEAEKIGIVRGKEINSQDIKNYFKKLLNEKRAY